MKLKRTHSFGDPALYNGATYSLCGMDVDYINEHLLLEFDEVIVLPLSFAKDLSQKMELEFDPHAPTYTIDLNGQPLVLTPFEAEDFLAGLEMLVESTYE